MDLLVFVCGFCDFSINAIYAKICVRLRSTSGDGMKFIQGSVHFRELS